MQNRGEDTSKSERGHADKKNTDELFDIGDVDFAQTSPVKPDVGGLLRRNVRTVVLTIVSAFAGAALASTTKVFEAGIGPIVSDVSCSARELFADNPAPNRLTVVITRFPNDSQSGIAHSAAKQLAEEYGVNAIETCDSIELRAEGDRERNAERARARIASLLSRYDADAVVVGDYAVGKPRVMTVTRNTLEYSFRDDVANWEEINGSDPSLYVSGPLYRHLMHAALELVERPGCLHVVYLACHASSAEKAGEFIKILSRIHLLQEFLFNRQRFSDWRPVDELAEFDAILTAHSAAAVALAAERLLNVDSAQIGGTLYEMEDFAERQLRVAHIIEQRRDHSIGDDRPSTSTAAARATVSTIVAERYGNIFYAERALEWYNQVLLDSEVLSRLNANSFILASWLGKGRAHAVVFAYADDDSTRMKTRVELERVSTMIDSLMPVDAASTFTYSTEFLGPEHDDFKRTLSDRFDGDRAVIRAVLNANTIDSVRALLRAASWRRPHEPKVWGRRVLQD